MLPMSVPVGHTTAQELCPTCVRLELDPPGVVKITVSSESEGGTVPGGCAKGHMTLVSWSRPDADADAAPDADADAGTDAPAG